MSEFSGGPWDEEIEVRVYVRVKAQPNPDYYVEDYGRTPEDLARDAASRGTISRLENADGWADLLGEAYVTDVYIP